MASNRQTSSSGDVKKQNRLSCKRSSDDISRENVNGNAVANEDQSKASFGKMKEKRKANWTAVETKTLVMQVMENYDIIYANHTGSERIETQKKKTWKDIVDLVNRYYFVLHNCRLQNIDLFAI